MCGCVQGCVSMFLLFAMEVYRNFNASASQCFSRVMASITVQQLQAQALLGQPSVVVNQSSTPRPSGSDEEGGGFDESIPVPTSITPIPAEAPALTAGSLTASRQSFNVLAECPKMIMVIQQLYRSLATPSVCQLIPHLVACVTTKLPQAVVEAGGRGGALAEKVLEFVTCQAKTLTYITFLMRGFGSELECHKAKLAPSICAMLTLCPLGATQVRRGWGTHTHPDKHTHTHTSKQAHTRFQTSTHTSSPTNMHAYNCTLAP